MGRGEGQEVFEERIPLVQEEMSRDCTYHLKHFDRFEDIESSNVLSFSFNSCTDGVPTFVRTYGVYSTYVQVFHDCKFAWMQWKSCTPLRFNLLKLFMTKKKNLFNLFKICNILLNY